VHASTATSIRRPANRAAHRDGCRRGIDPTATHLARLAVQRVEGDLRSMHVKPGYDRHQGLLRVPAAGPVSSEWVLPL
jgi:hypothetical protein